MTGFYVGIEKSLRMYPEYRRRQRR